MSLSKESKQKIADKLKERFGDSGLECPMCHHKSFQIDQGYVIHRLSDYVDKIDFSKNKFLSTPTIPIICTNCGFVSFHSMGILGFLENK